MKSYYKNTQNKLQEDYANSFIELIFFKKKDIWKKISFPKISKDFIKNNFEWVISIYLFTKYFLQVIRFNFICIKFSKKVIYIYCIKRIYYKISIWLQNFNLATKIVLFAFTKKEWIFKILFTKVFQFVFIE